MEIKRIEVGELFIIDPNNEFSKFNLPVEADYFARDIKIFGNKIYIDNAVPYGGQSPKDYFAIINKDTMQLDGLLPQYLVPSFKNETTIDFNFVPLNTYQSRRVPL